MSTLDNIINGRNFLYKGVYSHHIVQYEQYLLARMFQSNKEFIKKFKIKDNEYLLPTDDDVYCSIKEIYESKNSDKYTYAKQFLTRNYEYKALGKTYFEFESLKIQPGESITKSAITEEELIEKYNIIHHPVKITTKSIEPQSFKVECADNKIIDATEIIGLENKNITDGMKSYYLIFVPLEIYEEKKDEIISSLSGTS